MSLEPRTPTPEEASLYTAEDSMDQNSNARPPAMNPLTTRSLYTTEDSLDQNSNARPPATNPYTTQTPMGIMQHSNPSSYDNDAQAVPISVRANSNNLHIAAVLVDQDDNSPLDRYVRLSQEHRERVLIKISLISIAHLIYRSVMKMKSKKLFPSRQVVLHLLLLVTSIPIWKTERMTLPSFD